MCFTVSVCVSIEALLVSLPGRGSWSQERCKMGCCHGATSSQLQNVFLDFIEPSAKNLAEVEKFVVDEALDVKKTMNTVFPVDKAHC